MLRRARAMMARATLLSALLVLAPAAPAAALSCVRHPFQAPGERFGTGVLVAEIEVLDVRPGSAWTCEFSGCSTVARSALP